MNTSTSEGKHGIQWTSRMQLDYLDFSDDLALLSHTQQQMQEKTTSVAAASAAEGLNIHKGKSKIFRYNTACTNPITIDGEYLEDVKTFTYLGSIIDEHGGSDADVKARIGKARAAYLQLKNIWNSKQLSTNTKFLLISLLARRLILSGMLRCFYNSVVVIVFFSLVTRSSKTENAQIECKQHNLSLVTLSTKSQQEFLREFQINFEPPIIASWIGLFTENGHLRWSSGYSAVPQIFISGRPGSVEGCAMSNISSGGLFTWEFIPCDTKLSFVCGNIPQTSYRHPFSNESTLICPHGYKLFDKNCYLVS
ncbi:unnamed protein product [Schistosoma margrebowiei]|uniref:Uncharacterized protein n=1 Tax=Schistosoma margrebowiei TaxID=48269 RepID=A0A183N2Y5_9TREM|nr:unnamed protein product [Schistosoma margrebowiei]